MTRYGAKKLQNPIYLSFNTLWMPSFNVHKYCITLDDFLGGPPANLNFSSSEFKVTTLHKENNDI